MADWFKFYENGIDEPRFRYALRTLSGVCPVWLLTLSECCRHRSDTFRWTGDEVDLIGWSEKACISPPQVNEAMKLLEKIRYIEIGVGYIKVLNWNKLQSEYCRKSSVKTPESVRSVSGQSPEFVRLEERRGEEIRREETMSERARATLGSSKPLSSAKPVKAIDGVLTELKGFGAKLMELYNRPATGSLTSYEESLAAAILRERVAFAQEFETLRAFKSTVRHFPQSLTKLLEGWQEQLDRVANQPKNPEPKKETTNGNF